MNAPRRATSRGTNAHTRGLLPLLVVALAIPSAACGRKAPPRPPDLVRPQTIRDLEARPVRDGIRLAWTRPTETVDGSKMPDLDGFVVERAVAPAPGAVPLFETIATIHLDDRERFSKIRRVEHIDRRAAPGTTYAYRVIAFTLDRYVSRPSRTAQATWPGPRPAPPGADGAAN